MKFLKNDINKQEPLEENWETKISKFFKSRKANTQSTAIPCPNYSSMTCLKCDKCWGATNRTTKDVK